MYYEFWNVVFFIFVFDLLTTDLYPIQPMKLFHIFLLILLTTSVVNAQNIQIIHSDFKSIVPGQKDGTLKNTYNYMVKSDKPVSIDTIDINENRIWFPNTSIQLNDSINIRVKLITNHYFSDKEQATKFVKVIINGKEITAKLENKPVAKGKKAVTSFLMSSNNRKFCLDITKFDTEIFVPMP